MVSRNVLGFSIAPYMQRVMECNGYYASIMRSDKLKTDNEGLPPGIPIPVLPTDYLKSRPSHWIGGYGSYVCPVDSNWGLWFNWTMNNIKSTAVLISVKGMNPITGQRISGLSLEQYLNKCPIHKVDFQHDRLCPKCGFKWPEQNYIASPNPFYLDGFRNTAGEVRQFYFTEDLAKSVPEQVIGKDDTIPAFGFCFYKSKDYRTEFEDGNRIKDQEVLRYFKRESKATIRCVSPGSYEHFSPDGIHDARGILGESSILYSASIEPTSLIFPNSETKTYGSGGICCSSGDVIIPDNAEYEREETKSSTKMSKSLKSVESKLTLCSESALTAIAGAMANPVRKSMDYDPHKATAEVGVGAGKKIKQEIRRDARELEQWGTKPVIMRIYFVFREQFEKYAKEGLNDLHGSKEGFLENVVVGG